MHLESETKHYQIR